MKQLKHFVYAALLAVLSAACAKEAPIPVENNAKDNNAAGRITFTATLDNAGGPATLTQLVAGNKVEWIAGDAISIFDGSTNKEVTTTDSGASASFSVDLTEAGPWYALYPYVSTASISGSKITTSVPSSQTAVDGSFADDLNISVAQSDAGALAFKNALGLIKFTVGKDNISKVVLRGNKAEVLAGTVEIDYNSGDPTWEATSGIRFIELAPAAGTFTNGGTYYFAVLPQDFSAGFSLNFIDNTGLSFIVSTSNDANLHRSEILNISTADGKITLDNNIVFADADVKADIVAAFDKNSDGELSYAEAAAVTYAELGALTWTNKDNVNTFDELQYFTGLVTTISRSDVPGGKDIRLPAIFTDCTNLTSVVLPRNLSTIDSKGFQNCSSLISIDLPNLRAIFANTFDGSGLTSVVIPNSVTSVSNKCFLNCTSLASVTISENLAELSKYMFQGCTSLNNVVIPDSVTIINDYAFDGCTSLAYLTLSENLTTIAQYAFHGCSALKGNPTEVANFPASGSMTFTDGDLYFPNAVVTIGDFAFNGCSSLKRAVFSDSNVGLTTIGNNAFQNCTTMTKFYCPSSNVIESIGNYAFDGNTKMSFRSRNFARVKTLGQYAFQKCAITNASLTSDQLTTIPRNAFYQCKSLVNVYFSSTVTSIEQFAFSGCIKMTGLSYQGTGRTGIELPEGLTTIGQAAFGGCELITTADFPSTVTSIGNKVFRHESINSTGRDVNLTTWTIRRSASVPTLGTGTFDGGGGVTSILVPAAKADDYKTATNWEAFAGVISGF